MSRDDTSDMSDMRNTTVQLRDSDNQEIKDVNIRLKNFLDKNPNLLINKTPEKIARIKYYDLLKKTPQPFRYKESQILCNRIQQILDESFSIAELIGDGDTIKESHFDEFIIRKYVIPLAKYCYRRADLVDNMVLETSYIGVVKIVDTLKYICNIYGSNIDSNFTDIVLRCMNGWGLPISPHEAKSAFTSDWDYDYQYVKPIDEQPTDDQPKEGGRHNKYKKCKTNKSKKSRKHIRSRRLSRSRRPAKSRRYKKSRK